MNRVTKWFRTKLGLDEPEAEAMNALHDAHRQREEALALERRVDEQKDRLDRMNRRNGYSERLHLAFGGHDAEH